MLGDRACFVKYILQIVSQNFRMMHYGIQKGPNFPLLIDMTRQWFVCNHCAICEYVHGVCCVRCLVCSKHYMQGENPCCPVLMN